MRNAFMRKAVELAVENVRSGCGGPFGAVIVRGGEVVAAAANRVAATNDPTAHAEVVAIRQACERLQTFDLRGCEIYASCEPCPMCLCAIYWARIDRIYYAANSADAAAAGFDDSRFYREICAPHSARAVPIVNLMDERSGEPFDAWKNSPLRVEY